MKQACDRLAYPRSSYYRQQQAKAAVTEPRLATPSPRALPQAERKAVQEMLNGERFVDSSPRQMCGTLLRVPVPHVYYHMYTILDTFSRYVVGYMIAAQELASLAHQLVADSCKKQGLVQQ